MIAVNGRDAEHAEVRDGERAVAQVGELERPTPGGVREPPRLRGDLGERLPVGVEDDRDEQGVVGRDGDADVDARVALDLSVDVGRVEAREVPERVRSRLDDEVVERGHDVALGSRVAPPRDDLATRRCPSRR